MMTMERKEGKMTRQGLDVQIRQSQIENTSEYMQSVTQSLVMSHSSEGNRMMGGLCEASIVRV